MKVQDTSQNTKNALETINELKNPVTISINPTDEDTKII